ncbi:hypothetical protein B0181_07475 [Moraxella caviae]|uniref:Uncharacterized protein n=1 Tax=Moraxella caviae TaxID=34060 RepID=A0A1T0A1B3_9GAMM|nr:hypothetical protein B0181_07475 [Moraxella caviae]
MVVSQFASLFVRLWRKIASLFTCKNFPLQVKFCFVIYFASAAIVQAKPVCKLAFIVSQPAN